MQLLLAASLYGILEWHRDNAILEWQNDPASQRCILTASSFEVPSLWTTTVLFTALGRTRTRIARVF